MKLLLYTKIGRIGTFNQQHIAINYRYCLLKWYINNNYKHDEIVSGTKFNGISMLGTSKINFTAGVTDEGGTISLQQEQ